MLRLKRRRTLAAGAGAVRRRAPLRARHALAGRPAGAGGGRGRARPRAAGVPVRARAGGGRLPAHGRARLADAAVRVRAPDRSQPARASAGDGRHRQAARPQAGPAPVVAPGRRARRTAGRPGARGRLRGRRAAARRAPARRAARVLGQPVRAAARRLAARPGRPDPPRRDHPGRHAGAFARGDSRAGARVSRLLADRSRRAAGVPQPGHRLAGDDVSVHLRARCPWSAACCTAWPRARSRRSSSTRSTPVWRTPTWPSSPWPAPARATSSSSWRCAICWPVSTSWSSIPRTSTARCARRPAASTSGWPAARRTI